MKKLLLLGLVVLVLVYWHSGHGACEGRGAGAVLLPAGTQVYCEIVQPGAWLGSPSLAADPGASSEVAGRALKLLSSFLGEAPRLDTQALLLRCRSVTVAAVPVHSGEVAWCVILESADSRDTLFRLQHDLAVDFIAATTEEDRRLPLLQAHLPRRQTTLWATHSRGLVLLSTNPSPIRWAERVLSGDYQSLAGSERFRVHCAALGAGVQAWGFGGADLLRLQAQGTIAESLLPAGMACEAFRVLVDSTVVLQGQTAATASVPSGAAATPAGEALPAEPSRPAEGGGWLRFVLYVMAVPVGLVLLLVLAFILLALYYYIEAWLSGSVYAKTIPESPPLSPAAESVVGAGPGTGGSPNEEPAASAPAAGETAGDAVADAPGQGGAGEGGQEEAGGSAQPGAEGPGEDSDGEKPS